MSLLNSVFSQNIDDALAKMNAIIERAVESVKPREVDPVKKKKIAKQYFRY